MQHVAWLDSGIADVGNYSSQAERRCAGEYSRPTKFQSRGNDLSRCHVEQVVVGVVTAKAGSGLHETQLVNDFITCVSGSAARTADAFASPIPLR